MQRLHTTLIVRVLNKDAENIFRQFNGVLRKTFNANAQVHSAAVQNRPRLRKYIFRNNEAVHPCLGRFAASRIEHHGHGLRSSRRLVEQTGIGHFHPCEVADHGLEVHQRFKSTLGNLSLIRRVSRVPTWVFKHISANDTRHLCRVIAHADVVAEQLILRSHLRNVLQVSRLGHGLRHVQPIRHQNGFWHGTADQFLHGIQSQNRQHTAVFLLAGTQVTLNKSS